MAIAYDSVSPDTASAANVASLTSGSWTIAGATRYLFAGGASGAGSPVVTANMKWGGSGGTALTALHAGTGVSIYGYMRAFGLIGPSASTTTLYGDWSANQDETMIGGVSYTGVDQSTPLRNSGTPNINTGTMPGSSPQTVSATVTGTTAGDVVVGLFYALDVAGTGPAFSGTGSSTLRYDVAPGVYEAFAILEITATGSSTTVQASLACSGAFAEWGVVAVAMIPSTGGGGPTGPPAGTLAMMGMGV